MESREAGGGSGGPGPRGRASERRLQQETLERLTKAGAVAIDDLQGFLQTAAELLQEVASNEATVELTVHTSELVMSASAGPGSADDAALQVPLSGPDGHVGFLRIFSDEIAEDSDLPIFLQLAGFAIASAVERAVTAHELTERGKELRALHAISQALHTSVSVEEQAATVARILADAFQYPPITTVEVRVDDVVRRAGPDEPVVTAIEAPVTLDMQPVGTIRVGYTALRDWLEPEETDLVNSAAALLGTWYANRRAEAERLQSQQLIEKALTTTPIGVLIVDRSGRLTFANDAMRQMLGLASDEPIRNVMKSRLQVETVDGDPIPEADRMFARVRAAGGPLRDLEYVLVAMDGRRRTTVSVNASPLFDSLGVFDGVVAAYTDITARKAAEMRLARNEARLEQLLARLPAVIWTTDTDLRITSIAGAGLDRLRTVPEIGEPLPDYFGDPDFEPVDAYRQAMDGETATASFWWQRVWWQVTLEPVRDAHGEVVGVIGVGLDSTELARARESADEHRKRLSALFHHSQDAIFLADDEGRYVDVNPAACRLTGRERGELLRLRPQDIAAHVPEAVEELQRRFEQDRQQSGDFLIERPDGTVVVTEYRAVRDILPGLHMSIVRDVSDRRAMERKLVESEARFRSIAERSWDGIFRLEIEPEMKYLYVNPAMSDLTGYPLEEVYGHPDLLATGLVEDDQELLVGAYASSDEEPVQVRFQRGDGEIRWFEIRLKVLRDEAHGTVEVQGVLNDVTAERERLDALEAALRREREAGDELRHLEDLRAAFLRAVSHELRTPLTSIYGLALTLQQNVDRIDAQTMARMLERLGVNAERMRALLDDLLDVNRLAEGRVLARREHTDLARAVAPIVEVVDVGDRTVNLETDPAPAHVDTATVQRATRAMLDNVVRHTPESTTVWVRTERFEEGAMLTIEDDGPGVPDGMEELIMQAFEQGEKARGAPSPGTGIGLYLTAQFARLHGGELHVDERPGGGARFRVWLPDE